MSKIPVPTALGFLGLTLAVVGFGIIIVPVFFEMPTGVIGYWGAGVAGLGSLLARRAFRNDFVLATLIGCAVLLAGFTVPNDPMKLIGALVAFPGSFMYSRALPGMFMGRIKQ